MRWSKFSCSIVFVMACVLGSIGPVSARGAEDAPAKPVPNRGPQAQLDRFKSQVYALKITDEQKSRLDPLFESATTDLKAAADAIDEKTQSTKAHQVLNKLRADVSLVLTNEQKLELRKTMAPPGPGAVIDRIKEQLHKPEFKLTEDQKTKTDQALDEAKAKLEALVAEVKAGGKDAAKEAGPKAKEIVEEMHKKLSEILSADQQKQLDGGKTAK